MKTYLLIAVFGLGCRSETSTSQGTVVGNPGDGAMRAGDGVDFQPEIARTSVSTINWKGCGGSEREISVGAEIDLLGENLFTVPVGNWCAVVVNFSDSLFIEGPFRVDDLDDDDEFEDDELWLQMEVGTERTVFVSEADGFDVSEDHLVIEFGEPDWYDPVALLEEELLSEAQWEALREGVFVVDDEHAQYGELLDRLENSSSLFMDSDGNGQISESERDEGPIAYGDSEIEDETEDENDKAEKDKKPKPSDGCGSGGGNAWLLLPFGLFVRRRGWRA